MKEIGNQLREAREKKKLSIQDVAIATKINNKTIQAIEEGESENLPAKPFLRGFVQTYARYLDLNVDEVMKTFLDTHGSTKPKPQIVEEEKENAVTHEEVQNKFELYKKLAYLAAAVIAGIFIYFIQKTVSKYEQESKIAQEQKEAVQSQLNDEKNLVEGPLTKEQSVALEEQKALATKEATPNTLTPPPVVTPPPQPEESKPEQKVVETPKVEAPKPEPVKVEPEKPVDTATTTTVQKTKPQQVIIEALDKVEIRYKKDGEREKVVRLKPQQFLTIQADEKVSLNISDSGAVSIIHNGRDKGVPGNLGQPKKISYP